MQVLLVEDERTVAAALARGLAAEGIGVTVARTGPEGLTRALDRGFDVVVLDILLPGLSGYEVLKRARAVGVRTPVLMLTAKDGEYDIADALDLGADDYLTKPFSFVVLLARLHALRRRDAASRPVVLRTGDLVVEPALGRCRRGTVEVALTAREFGILEYLMREPGVLHSKAEILAEVWDENLDASPNLVEVHVASLRRKLDRPFGRASIETVRGFGYRVHVGCPADAGERVASEPTGDDLGPA